MGTEAPGHTWPGEGSAARLSIEYVQEGAACFAVDAVAVEPGGDVTARGSMSGDGATSHGLRGFVDVVVDAAACG